MYIWVFGGVEGSWGEGGGGLWFPPCPPSEPPGVTVKPHGAGAHSASFPCEEICLRALVKVSLVHGLTGAWARSRGAGYLVAGTLGWSALVRLERLPPAVLLCAVEAWRALGGLSLLALAVGLGRLSSKVRTYVREEEACWRGRFVPP